MTVEPWRATVLTLFPGMFPGPLATSLVGKGLAEGRWDLDLIDIRDYATDRHRSVDDQPFGGGPGMVMRPDVVSDALASFAGVRGGDTVEGSVDQDRPILYLSPRGRPLDQPRVRALAAGPGVALLCGRFEGVDQRVLDAWPVEEVSLGDFVLSGGEIAAMALLDACVRLLPGVLGEADSLIEESFESGLLEYPHYTRPRVWRDQGGKDRAVPDILISGHHEKIADWRRQQAVAVTQARRPDLWRRYAAAQREQGVEL
ncbi:MAG: tRNA (guanosine(37)-N1)-methyltransferase TrmD [Alphaproteobacteria bacterium]